MKHNKMVLANAFAVVIAATYLLCYFLSLFAPDLLMAIGNSWIHLTDLEKIRVPMVFDIGGFVFGLVTSGGAAWLFGYVLGAAIEYFEKNK